LLPRDGSDGWRTLAEMGQAWGLLDSIVTWLRASRQSEPKRVAAIVAGETIRANRAADALEVAVANGAYGGSLDATQIVLGAGLGMIEPMLRLWTWREGRPGLSAWYDAIAARPSFQLTEPPSR
jgi:glutathione S-transferase